MMSSVYELIGRLVVRVAWLRFGRQIKVAGVVVGVLALVLAYAGAKRRPPEG